MASKPSLETATLCCNCPGSKNINRVRCRIQPRYITKLWSHTFQMFCIDMLLASCTTCFFSFSGERSKMGFEDSQVLYTFWEKAFPEAILSCVYSPGVSLKEFFSLCNFPPFFPPASLHLSFLKKHSWSLSFVVHRYV